MQFRLIVALCVVGCLYAVQAKPVNESTSTGEYKREWTRVDGPVESLNIVQLINNAYYKLFTMLETLPTTEATALRESLIKFILSCSRRLYYNNPENVVNKMEEGIKRFRRIVIKYSPERLVDQTYIKHRIILESTATRDEIEYFRNVFTEFLKDETPDIMYYIERIWKTEIEPQPSGTPFITGMSDEDIEREFSMYYIPINEQSSFKELLKEVVRKLHILRDSVWSTKKIEVNRLIIKLIKRADEELLKHDQVMVEVLFKPDEYLETLPYPFLVRELLLRIIIMFEGVWSAPIKTSLIDFLKNIEKQIVKYNRIE